VVKVKPHKKRSKSIGTDGETNPHKDPLRHQRNRQAILRPKRTLLSPCLKRERGSAHGIPQTLARVEGYHAARVSPSSEVDMAREDSTEVAVETLAGKQERLVQILKDINDEGQGIWTLKIYPPDRRSELLYGMIAGDPMSIAVVRSVTQAIEAHVQCTFCDNRFSKDFMPNTPALLTANVEHPERCLFMAVCDTCREKYPENYDLVKTLFEFVRQHMISDARKLDINQTTGNA